MVNPIKVELAGALAGQSITLDDNLLTIGFLEDLQEQAQAQSFRGIRETLARAILESSFLTDEGAAALRALKPVQLGELIRAIMGRFELPKAS